MEGKFFYMAFGQGCQVQHDFKINFNNFLNTGPLEFNGHCFTIF